MKNYKIYASGQCYAKEQISNNTCCWQIIIEPFKALLPIIKFFDNEKFNYHCQKCNKEYIYSLDRAKWLFVFENNKCEFRIDILDKKMVVQKNNSYIGPMIPFNNLLITEYSNKLSNLISFF